MNKQTASGLAIAGFVVLLISLVIPYYGLHIGGIALALVTVAGFFREKTFTILTVVLSAVKVLFLSPTFRLLTHQFQEGDSYQYGVWFIFVVAHAAPLVAMFYAAHRVPASSEQADKTSMPRGN